MNSDKCIAPIASAGRVADCVVARREAGEHTSENYHGKSEIGKLMMSGLSSEHKIKSSCVVASEQSCEIVKSMWQK